MNIRSLRYAALVFMAQIGLVLAAAKATPIAPSDVLVYRCGNTAFTAGSDAAAFQILDINPMTSAVAQTFDSAQFPGARGQLFTTTSRPFAALSLSNNKTQVSVSGWRSPGPGALLANTQGIPRGAAALNSNGQFSFSAAYNPATLNHIPDQVHTAYSPDGVNWYFGDTDGMFYNNGTAKLTGSDATLSIKGFGAATYALHALRSANDTENNGANVISLVSPATPGNNIINYGTVVASSQPSQAMRDFYLLSSANNGVFDSLYVTTPSAVLKYALLNGIWTALGSTGVSGAMGIAVAPSAGSGVTIYVSADSNFATLQKITDSAAFNLNMIASPATILYTAPQGSQLMGVSLAPVPEPSSLMLAALAATVILIASIRRGAMRKYKRAVGTH
jgi:hypothetical protein